MKSPNEDNCVELAGSVIVLPSPRGGRGLFARIDLVEGVYVGCAFSWILTPSDIKQIDRTSIEGFWFDHPQRSGWGLFPVGAIALVNHSIAPNAEINWNESELGFIGHLVTTSRVSRGQEILVDYGIELPDGWIP